MVLKSLDLIESPHPILVTKPLKTAVDKLNTEIYAAGVAEMIQEIQTATIASDITSLIGRIEVIVYSV